MNVLSVFDGMSCGRVALERAGITVNKYYSSEIDKHAITVANDNYPSDTPYRLGDVVQVEGWELDDIDLLIGGSPCQGFSFAGKQLNFDDPRSVLFFEFVRLKNELNPQWFLLENVKMKKEHQDVISSYLGVEPVLINSSLVSAQSRERLYWTNIPIQGVLEDKDINIKDIIEDIDDITPLLIPESKVVNTTLKRNYLQYDVHGKGYGSQDQRAYHLKGKHGCLPAGCNSKSKILLPNGRVRNTTIVEKERLQTLPDNYTKSVSAAQGSKMIGNGWTVDVITHLLKGLK